MKKDILKEILVVAIDFMVPIAIIVLLFNILAPKVKKMQNNQSNSLEAYETEYVEYEDTFHGSDGKRYSLVQPEEDVSEIEPMKDSIRKLDREMAVYSEEFEKLIKSINETLQRE